MGLNKSLISLLISFQIISFSISLLGQNHSPLTGIDSSFIEINSLLDSAKQVRLKDFNNQLSKTIALQALELSRENHYKFGQGISFILLGQYHDYLQEYDKALNYYLQSKNYFETDKDLNNLNHLIGILHGKKGDFQYCFEILSRRFED